MFMMLTVASLSAVALIAGLLALVCRYREDLWFATDDMILCLISPVMIALATFGFVSLGWRLTHGGFAEVSLEGWIGSVVVIAIAFGIWFAVAPRIRASRKKPTDAAHTSSDPAKTPN